MSSPVIVLRLSRSHRSCADDAESQTPARASLRKFPPYTYSPFASTLTLTRDKKYELGQTVPDTLFCLICDLDSIR